MKQSIILCTLIILTAIFSFFAGHLISIHHLDISFDNPKKQIYVTDFLNQTWIYDYNYSD